MNEEFHELEIDNRFKYIDACMSVLAGSLDTVNPYALSHHSSNDIWRIIRENFHDLSAGIDSLRKAIQAREGEME